ncbi:unnamed protein product [Ilex paraguariensis]|uniref:RRM domain-containing protein n=1 Tax=Ilex paraguariensis TaxID=185542 RepID=A0ABC8T7R7_9AQUA
MAVTLPPLAAAPPFDLLREASLYVGDLHPEVNENDLVQAFRVMGPLVSVYLCRDRVTYKSLRYGFVNFFFPSHASRALACLNHTELKGKTMRIMWCEKDPVTRNTGIANLFVKNLHPSVSSARLQSIFSKFGNIISCKVAEENGKSKGFGFVQYDREGSAITALNALHGTVLEGKKFIICNLFNYLVSIRYVSKFVRKSQQKDYCDDPKFTNLYVKNVDKDLTEDFLRDKFSKYGKISNAAIMKDDEGKSKGFGFVNFESHEEAEKAVEAMNGVLIGSKKIFVGRAQKKAEREELLKRAREEMLNRHAEMLNSSDLYVKNLNISIDGRKLEEIFSAFGEVKSTKVVCDKNGVSKGFGFVSFSNPEGAKKALNALNGTTIEGKSLYVTVAQPTKERRRDMQIRLPQYPPHPYYTSNWDSYATKFRPIHYDLPLYPPEVPPHSHQPTIYQYHGRHAGAFYPFGAHKVDRNFSTYNPAIKPLQGAAKDWILQQLNSRKIKNERSGAAEGFSKGSTVTKKYFVTSSAHVCKNNIGEPLHPSVENLQAKPAANITEMLLQIKNSDMQKLLNSWNSKAMEVERVV